MIHSLILPTVFIFSFFSWQVTYAQPTHELDTGQGMVAYSDLEVVQGVEIQAPPITEFSRKSQGIPNKDQIRALARILKLYPSIMDEGDISYWSGERLRRNRLIEELLSRRIAYDIARSGGITISDPGILSDASQQIRDTQEFEKQYSTLVNSLNSSDTPSPQPNNLPIKIGPIDISQADIYQAQSSIRSAPSGATIDQLIRHFGLDEDIHPNSNLRILSGDVSFWRGRSLSHQQYLIEFASRSVILRSAGRQNVKLNFSQGDLSFWAERPKLRKALRN